MPKEVIQHGERFFDVVYHETENHSEFSERVRYHGEISELTGEPVIDGRPQGDEKHLTRDPHLEVHWSKPGEFGVQEFGKDEEGKVQIMLDLDRYALLQWAERVKEDELIASSAAISGNLTRYQLNKLIKVLRRARDQAYGTDE